MSETGLVFSEKFLLHDTGVGHPERPERLSAIMQAFKREGWVLPRLPDRHATMEDLLRVHCAEHISTVKATCLNDETYPDPDTPMGHDSWEAALLAAGGCIAACDAVLKGEYRNVFCAVRPPGHHAEYDRAMGFCLFNNIAVAAKWLQQQAGIGRIAILDWDVHHGNGTQQAFYDDPTVFFASVHQHPLYPGTGWPSERGANNSNLNIQMRQGAGQAEWMSAIDDAVLPEIKKFDPEFLLVSAGFDNHRLDPLGGQKLDTDTYAWITRRITPIAGGRLVSILEGGYNLEALGDSVVAHVRELMQVGPISRQQLPT